MVSKANVTTQANIKQKRVSTALNKSSHKKRVTTNLKHNTSTIGRKSLNSSIVPSKTNKPATTIKSTARTFANKDTRNAHLIPYTSGNSQKSIKPSTSKRVSNTVRLSNSTKASNTNKPSARNFIAHNKKFLGGNLPLNNKIKTLSNGRNTTRLFSSIKLLNNIKSSTIIKPYGSLTKPPYMPSKNNISENSLHRIANNYKNKVFDAYKNRRIFTIHGNFHTIRAALLEREWIEKTEAGRYLELSKLSEKILLKKAKNGNDYENVILNKLMAKLPAFFIWQPRAYIDRYENVLPYRNHVKRSDKLNFTTKVGLIGCAEQGHWFQSCGLWGMSYPRFYRLKNPSERKEFIEDYRRTQCRSLIRFVFENISIPNKLLNSKDGTMMPTKLLTYAINYMEQQLNEWEFSSLDLENENKKDSRYNGTEWNDFLKNSTSIIMGKQKFRISFEELREFAMVAKDYLNIVEERRSDFKWDGVRNLWILKPGSLARGIGVVIKHSLNDILEWETRHTFSNYVVQKYVERPLLIYKCKFDIRQYMLLTIGKDMASIWLYKDCYLRFCSHPYSIDDLRESIHLTNNSVQRNYKIAKERDSRLPRNNMWSLDDFKEYLMKIDAPKGIWEQKIFRGFRESLVAIVLASFEETQFIENTFELFGCDFMIDEEYNPILIEINSSPDISPSTPITARICPMALQDLIKVVVDLPNDPNASTGLFEIAHKVNYKSMQDFDPEVGLNIYGKAMTIHKEKEEKIEQEKISKNRFYQNLASKRLQLMKILSCFKGSPDSEENKSK